MHNDQTAVRSSRENVYDIKFAHRFGAVSRQLSANKLGYVLFCWLAVYQSLS